MSEQALAACRKIDKIIRGRAVVYQLYFREDGEVTIQPKLKRLTEKKVSVRSR